MSASDRKRGREQEWGDGIKEGTRSPVQHPVAGTEPAADGIKGWKPYFPSPSAPLDLNVVDLPSDHSPLEWWYYNTHLKTKSGREFSAFASFFRQGDSDSISKADRAAHKPYTNFFHCCTWALVDVKDQKYTAESLLDHRACENLVRRLDPKYTGRKTVHAETALLELARKNRLPRPDRMMKKPAVQAKDKLSLSFDGECTLEAVKPSGAKDSQPASAPKRVYKVHTHNPNKNITLDLSFVPQMPPVLHGSSGVVNEMFYYYIPRCNVYGTLQVGDLKEEVTGSGWYDREFGGSADAVGTDAMDAWTWFSIQLSDDYEFTLFNVVDRNTCHEKEKICVLSNRDGTRVCTHEFTLAYSNMWTSLNTYAEYPMMWKLTVPSIQLELHMGCAMNHQEHLTVLVTGGGFYEGRVHVQGVHSGKAVTGLGFLERKNHTNYSDTAGLLKNVGRFVRKTLSDMYPLKATKEWIDKKIMGRHATLRGVDPQIVCDTFHAPVRALIDRGGKSWRSLVLVSSINCLAGEFFDCSPYIAMAELLHVGSLIIDDIQDDSTVRRGGKAVHLEFGLATAINAGTGCYFTAPMHAGLQDLPYEKRAKIYDLYFDVLRSGHAGQGLDIHGLNHLMPQVVETGDTRDVLDALQAIHIFKTGGAAATLTQCACVLCDANALQAKWMENFGLQLGLAFQIVDDALNLKGFEGELKEVGEDIKDGKITYPVIKAMSRLSKFDRQYVWSILQEHTDDRGKISSVISMLNRVGAIDDCLVEARNLVEEAWEKLDPHLEDSLPKVMMRTFCGYLTERTF